MKKIILFMAFVVMATNAQAFNFPFLKLVHTDKVGKSYFSGDDEGMIFSWTKNDSYTYNIRFSYFMNSGFRYNYNITRKIAVFSGLGIKNVGTADRISGKVYRARNYYAGLPLGVRIGNLKNKSEIAFGGGVDFTVHHKEKTWTEGSKRSTKTKFNCVWFDNTYSPFVNPYLFASIKIKGIGVKYQYYTQAFFKGGNTNLQYIGIILDTGSPVQMGGKSNRKTKKIKKSINSI